MLISRPCKLQIVVAARLALRLFFGAVSIISASVVVAVDGGAPNSGSVTNQLVPSSGTNAAPKSRLRDPQDGWFDVSGFLDTAYGFVPMAMPITEPAVGYGAGGGLVFIGRHEPKPGEEYRKPNLTAVGGMGTENGSWVVFAGDSRTWLDGKLETLVGAGYGSINLNYYGVGDGPLNGQPVDYNLEPLGGLVEGRWRFGRSPVRAGLAYTIASTHASFDSDALPDPVRPVELDSRIAGVTPKLIYDSRNNLFTPTAGTYVEANAGIFREALGGSSDFETANLNLLYYLPIAEKLTLGINGEVTFSFGDAPFYTRPFVSLRGVAIRRYVGEHAADVELEARWQFWKRFSVVGFAGTGVAWNNFEHFQSEQVVVTGGVGFRYELARKYGLHMGLDVAFGPDDPAIYLQFGSAWFRP